MGKTLIRRILEEYNWRVKNLCRFKLIGGNLVSGVSAWPVGTARYGAGMFESTKEIKRQVT